jgi:hypothetical protein
MLRGHCPRHGRTVLVSTSRIEGVDTVDGAHLVRWRCTCGARSITRVDRRSLDL